MQIVASDDGGGPSALGIRLEDGVLPTCHTEPNGIDQGKERVQNVTCGPPGFTSPLHRSETVFIEP